MPLNGGKLDTSADTLQSTRKSAKWLEFSRCERRRCG
jgi:hypothetical protein